MYNTLTMESEVLAQGDLLRNRYRVEDVIGRGAYGMVYRVSDLTIPGSFWAVKEIREGALSDEERAEALLLFKKEAIILKELNHTGIPKVMDFFSEGPRHYMVMELIEGETMEALMKREKPEVRTAIAWASKLCDILEYLHSLNPPVIFRDLKPSNIMITKRGRLMLIDFGIARLFNPLKKQDTAIMGTPGFSPPEQYGTGQSDARSDVYSLGATLYHVLSGEDLEQFVFSVPPLSRYNRQVSPALEIVIARCLQKDPAHRYRSVGELKKDLAGITDRQAAAPSPAMQPPAPAAQPQAPAQGSSQPSSVPLALTGGAWVLFLLFGMSRSHHYYDLIGSLFIGALIVTLCSFVYYIIKGSCSMAFFAAALTLFFVFFLFPNLMRPPNRSGYSTACKSNLKNIGTAMEMYSSDSQGRYPPALKYITPYYLKTIPTCASAGKATYGYIYTTEPDIYTAWCSGSYHTPMTNPNYPQYDAVQGLYEK